MTHENPYLARGLGLSAPRAPMMLRDSCPRCGGTKLTRDGTYLDLLRCLGCKLTFDNKPPPRFDPTGIEYLDQYLAAGGEGGNLDGLDRFESVLMRKDLVKEYAWAIPDERALQRLVALGPLVEIGAGGGYWAMLLRERGADVVAYDRDPGDNRHVGRLWTEVLRGGPGELKMITGRALFLCWPPYATSMAYRCLVHFQGDTLAYIGEHDGGCCATDQFFRELDRKWIQKDEVHIASWSGIHDYLSIWQRVARVS